MKHAQLPAIGNTGSQKPAVHNRNEPTPSGHKRKRQRTVSTASAEEQNTANSNPYRKMIVETPEDRDAYILQRVLRWEQRGVRFDWQNVARFLHMPVQTVRTRYAELTGVALDTVPAILIHSMPTKTRSNIDLSTTENQNEFIVQRIKQWHANSQKFTWKTLFNKLGWTRQATIDRDYELVK